MIRLSPLLNGLAMNSTLTPTLTLPLEVEVLPGRDLFAVASFMMPSEAHVTRGFLEAGGIPAVVADANHAQADMLIAPAMGGVRVLVPQAHLEEARALLAARERGEFALDEDEDDDADVS